MGQGAGRFEENKRRHSDRRWGGLSPVCRGGVMDFALWRAVALLAQEFWPLEQRLQAICPLESIERLGENSRELRRPSWLGECLPRQHCYMRSRLCSRGCKKAMQLPRHWSALVVVLAARFTQWQMLWVCLCVSSWPVARRLTWLKRYLSLRGLPPGRCWPTRAMTRILCWTGSKNAQLQRGPRPKPIVKCKEIATGACTRSAMSSNACLAGSSITAESPHVLKKGQPFQRNVGLCGSSVVATLICQQSLADGNNFEVSVIFTRVVIIYFFRVWWVDQLLCA